MTIKIGTDPEVFLRDTKRNMLVSACGMFPGTKDEPYPLQGGALQVDGHALEFNTDPVSTEDDFVNIVQSVFGQVKEFVRNTDPNLEIVLEPVARFDPAYFNTLPPWSKELGCNPDYDGFTGIQLLAPDISEVPIRTGSGHIHIGWTEYDEPFDEQEFKKRLEIASKVTPYLLKAAESWETPASIERRNYYGGHMAFRPKHYGVELRALDNLWLKSEDTIRQVFRTTVQAFEREAAHAL